MYVIIICINNYFSENEAHKNLLNNWNQPSKTNNNTNIEKAFKPLKMTQKDTYAKHIFKVFAGEVYLFINIVMKYPNLLINF